MRIDKDKIETLDEDETTEMDQANERVQAEIQLLRSQAKQQVAEGLQDEELAEDAERLRREAEKELEDLNENRHRKL